MIVLRPPEPERRHTASASTVAATSCTRTMCAPRCTPPARLQAGRQAFARLATDQHPSVDLRDQPTNSGWPRVAINSTALHQLPNCAPASCRTRSPDRAPRARHRHTGVMQACAFVPAGRSDCSHDVVIGRRLLHRRPGRHRACASDTRRRLACAATASSAPGRRSARTSLTMSARAASAARISAGLLVSIDTGTPSVQACSNTGSTRSISSCSLGAARARAGGFAANVEDVGALAAPGDRSARARRRWPGGGRRRRTNPA